MLYLFILIDQKLQTCLLVNDHAAAVHERDRFTSCKLPRAGFHLEGPFISAEKKGAHPEKYLRTFEPGGLEHLMEVYGSLDDVAIVTLAPELPGSQSVVRELSQRGVTVSLGEHRVVTATIIQQSLMMM